MTEHVFLRLPDVKRITKKGKTTIYRDIKKGKFPKQFRNGEGSVAWLESEIHKWQEERISQR